MLKSGLIIGAVTLVLASILGFIFPLCIPCLAILVGAGAGYLAGMFDKPQASGNSAKIGAGAGAIGGIGALIGHVVGGTATSLVTGPEQAAALMRQFGVAVDTSNPAVYYAGAVGGACCFGLFEVLLMAGVGALGGMLWYQFVGKNSAVGSPPASMA